MPKTLEQILKDQEEMDISKAVSVLAESLRKQDEGNSAELIKVIGQIVDSQKEVSTLLQKLIDKPDPEYPEQKEVEFPEVQEVSMKKPDWYSEYDLESMYKSWTASLVAAFSPFFVELQKIITTEGVQTRAVLNELLNKESEEIEEPEPAKTVNTGAVRSRRTTQWKIATYPQVTGTVALVPKGDGLTYYLPSACIPNSETIRLNQGAPLSHGVDYTITGNAITYALDQTGSQQEVRYQTR